MLPKRKVFGQRPSHEQAFVLSIFRNDGDTKLANVPCRPHGNIASEEFDAARTSAFWVTRMKHGLNQFGLPVALDACDTNDLAAIYRQSDIRKPVSGAE